MAVLKIFTKQTLALSLQGLKTSKAADSVMFRSLGPCQCCVDQFLFKAKSSSSFGFSLQSGVVTAYHVSPKRPIFNVLLPSANFPHILFYYILLFLYLLFFGLPLFLFPGNSISITLLPAYS